MDILHKGKRKLVSWMGSRELRFEEHVVPIKLFFLSAFTCSHVLYSRVKAGTFITPYWAWINTLKCFTSSLGLHAIFQVGHANPILQKPKPKLLTVDWRGNIQVKDSASKTKLFRFNSWPSGPGNQHVNSQSLFRSYFIL